MKYSIDYASSFKRDFKRCLRRGLPIAELEKVIRILAEEGQLPPEYKAHRLKGNYAGKWECHIKPDWLMVWEQNDYELTLLLLRTGSHSDIF